MIVIRTSIDVLKRIILLSYLLYQYCDFWSLGPTKECLEPGGNGKKKMYPSYSLGRGMVDMQRSRIAGFFVVCVHATRSYMLYTCVA